MDARRRRLVRGRRARRMGSVSARRSRIGADRAGADRCAIDVAVVGALRARAGRLRARQVQGGGRRVGARPRAAAAVPAGVSRSRRRLRQAERTRQVARRAACRPAAVAERCRPAQRARRDRGWRRRSWTMRSRCFATRIAVVPNDDDAASQPRQGARDDLHEEAPRIRSCSGWRMGKADGDLYQDALTDYRRTSRPTVRTAIWRAKGSIVSKRGAGSAPASFSA